VATRKNIDRDVIELVERLTAGDSDAWAEFIERYRRLIYSAIVRANARFHAQWDETTMEEIFEEALFKLVRRRGKALASWKGECKLETWIYRIARNVCVDTLRKQVHRRECDEPGQQDGEPDRSTALSTASDVGRRDLRMSLDQAIERTLSPKEALVVRLIYFEGFTYREVADRLGMTVGAMSGFVYRALAKLRRDGGVARHWEER